MRVGLFFFSLLNHFYKVRRTINHYNETKLDPTHPTLYRCTYNINIFKIFSCLNRKSGHSWITLLWHRKDFHFLDHVVSFLNKTIRKPVQIVSASIKLSILGEPLPLFVPAIWAFHRKSRITPGSLPRHLGLHTYLRCVIKIVSGNIGCMHRVCKHNATCT